MFSFLKSKARYAVACDISRAAVKLMVFSYDRARHEFSCLDHKVAALPRPSDKLDNFIRALGSLEEFIGDAAGRLGLKIENVLVSVPDSILVADVHNFRFLRPEPEKAVSSGELAELWGKLEAEAEEVLFPQGTPPGAYRLIPPEPEHFSMDGYTVRAEMRPKGRELVIAALVSAWPDDFADAADIIAGKFPKIRFQILPQASAIRDYIGFKARENFSGMAADIGAEDSTFLLFHAGALDDWWVFPFGGNDVTEALASEFGVTFNEAETLKRQWSQAALDEAASIKAAAAAGRVIEYWKHEWKMLLSARAETRVIASEIYLVGGGANLPILINAFSDPDWLENFSSGRVGQVELLSFPEKDKPFFRNWPFAGGGGEVIFSLVSRMIQQAGRRGL